VTLRGVAYYKQTDRQTDRQKDRHHNRVTYCVFRLYRCGRKKMGQKWVGPERWNFSYLTAPTGLPRLPTALGYRRTHRLRRPICAGAIWQACQIAPAHIAYVMPGWAGRTASVRYSGLRFTKTSRLWMPEQLWWSCAKSDMCFPDYRLSCRTCAVDKQAIL